MSDTLFVGTGRKNILGHLTESGGVSQLSDVMGVLTRDSRENNDRFRKTLVVADLKRAVGELAEFLKAHPHRDTIRMMVPIRKFTGRAPRPEDKSVLLNVYVSRFPIPTNKSDDNGDNGDGEAYVNE